MFQAFRMFLIALSILAPASYSQQILDEVNLRSEEVSGLHLSGLSVYGGYSTSVYPATLQSAASLLATSGLGGDATYGVMGSIGWQRHFGRSYLYANYTGSYNRQAHYSQLDAVGQSLSVGFSRQLGRKWMLTMSAMGQDSTVAQYLFAPSQLAITSQLPASFDDLAAAFSVGQFSSSQIASMLTGAPLLESPERTLLLGDRILDYSGSVNLAVAVSRRVTIQLSSFAAGGQYRVGGGTAYQADYLLPVTFGGSGGVSFSYNLSPRTTVGLSFQEMRQVNRLQASYITSGTASFGRKLSEHWFARLAAGSSYALMTRQISGTPPSWQIIGGAGLGYKVRSHALLASYDRTGTDSFGLAVGTSSTFKGGWDWHRPGSGWNVVASFGGEQIRNTGYSSLDGWQASGSVSRYLTSRTSATVEYVYFDSYGLFAGQRLDRSIQSVRLSLGWTPQAALR